MRSVLRLPLAWAGVALATAVAIVTTFAYLGAFLDPAGNARDLPVAIVNGDAGASIGGQRVDLGWRLVATLVSRRSPLGDAVEWTALPSRRAALERIRRDQAFAAVVIPRDYSRRLAALALPPRGLSPAAQVQVLTNPAAGSFARTATEELATRAVMGLSMRLAQELASTGADGETPARVAHRVGDAVQVRSSEATPTGERSARGLAPFYFALTLALAGFIGTVIISIAVELVDGRLALDLFALRLHRTGSGVSHTSRWATKLVLALALSVLAGTLQTVLAVVVLGMTATNRVELALFAVLGVAAAAMVTLAFLVPFGLAGSLVGVLFVTIFGVPASGGPYPIEMLPGFFRFLAAWLPLRYLTDGARSLVFLDGRLDAGLGTAIAVLLAYAAGAALLGGATALAIDRRLRRNAPVQGAAPAPAG